MAIGITGGAHDRGMAIAVDPQKMMGFGCCLHRIDRDGGTAIRAVLVTDRHRQTRCHLPVGLALGGAGTDGRPADQISDVLRHDRVEQFSGCRHALPSQIQQQAPRPTQPGVDVVGAIEMGIIDQSLPTNRGAGFLEIHPHHNLQLTLEPLPHGRQAFGVLPRSANIVDRARSHHHQQPLVFPPQDRLNPSTGRCDRLHGGGVNRQIAVQQSGSHQRSGLHHVQIRGGGHDLARESDPGYASCPR